jgi:hypothetical protein
VAETGETASIFFYPTQMLASSFKYLKIAFFNIELTENERLMLPNKNGEIESSYLVQKY